VTDERGIFSTVRLYRALYATGGGMGDAAVSCGLGLGLALQDKPKLVLKLHYLVNRFYRRAANHYAFGVMITLLEP